MKVTVDQNKCVGSGQCVLLAPDVFDQREDDGIVLLLQQSPPEELDEAVSQAATICPARVIHLA